MGGSELMMAGPLISKPCSQRGAGSFRATLDLYGLQVVGLTAVHSMGTCKSQAVLAVFGHAGSTHGTKPDG